VGLFRAHSDPHGWPDRLPICPRRLYQLYEYDQPGDRALCGVDKLCQPLEGCLFPELGGGHRPLYAQRRLSQSVRRDPGRHLAQPAGRQVVHPYGSRPAALDHARGRPRHHLARLARPALWWAQPRPRQHWSAGQTRILPDGCGHSAAHSGHDQPVGRDSLFHHQPAGRPQGH